ncbi:MAG TPA: L-rhamnose mutarotase [Pyrinomonadaceae bacterium]|nr:L-rhamnose mutarotase [Pyrinomonadaceae bacterium]
MERKAFRTRLKPEFREQYIDAHRNFSAELHSRYLEAGVRNISIFLFGNELFMYVEAESFEKVQTMLADDALDKAWQQHVGPMKDSGSTELLEIFHLG